MAPLLSVLERIMDGTAKQFPAKSVLDCRILHIQSQKNFPGPGPPQSEGATPCRIHYPPPAKRPPVLGSRHQFPLGSPAFSLFPFYQTTTALHPCCYVGNSAVNYRHFCSVRSTSRRYRDCKGRKTCAPQILEPNRTEMPTFQ